MFPTVDPGVIEMILESVGGSQDRAIEQLLSMTDENFRPDELASVRQEESVRRPYSLTTASQHRVISSVYSVCCGS